MFFLSLISCTVGITQSLYFNQDNKVLVTLPMSGISLFLSKLIIFYIEELKKAMLFTIPIILACFIFCNDYISIATYFWMIIPILIYIALPVLLGSLLSIVGMCIKRLFDRLPIIQGIIIVGVVVGFVFVVVKLINLIPENINLLEQWGQMRAAIRDFLLNTENKMVVFSQFVYSLTGELTASGTYRINAISLLKVSILFASVGLLFGIVLLIIKPTKKNIQDIVTTITEYDVNREIKKSFKTDYEIENDKQENYSKFKQSFINKLKVLETINDTYYNHFKQKTNEMFFPLQEELNKLDEENNQLSKEIKRYQQELENKNMIIFTRDRTIRTLEIQNKALSEELEKQKWNSNYYQKLSNIRLQQLEELRKINKTIINN